MAFPKPEYEYYTATYGGSLDEETFDSSLSAAYGRACCRCCAYMGVDLTEDEQAAFSNAVCAAVDSLSEETAGVSSYSAGSISVTYSEGLGGNTVTAAIERELSGTRLIETGL